MLERQDYVKANAKLTKKVVEAAELLRKKMEQLDIRSLSTDNITVTLLDIKANGGQFRDKILCIDDGMGDLLQSTCALDSGYYWTGDFNCWVQYATPEEFLTFANNWQDIVKEITALETSLVKERVAAVEAIGDLPLWNE